MKKLTGLLLFSILVSNVVAMNMALLSEMKMVKVLHRYTLMRILSTLTQQLKILPLG